MEIVLALVGLIVGAVITWCVAHKYYVKAGEDLRKEASELRKLNVLILRGMEESGLVKFNRDENGNPVGLVIELSVSDGIVVKGVASGNLQVNRQEENNT